METFRLKQLREEKKLTQQELAERLSCSQQSINSYENHGTQPDMAMLCKMADLFETSVDYLVGHSNVRDSYALAKDMYQSERENDLINNYRELPQEIQTLFLELVQSYNKN